jgi:hypothetical protein
MNALGEAATNTVRCTFPAACALALALAALLLPAAAPDFDAPLEDFRESME